MRHRIESLTGLRFVFVVLLFLHHLDMFADLSIPGYNEVMRYFFEGAVSVDFFFILSGFVITYSYLSKVQNREISSGTFLFNRAAKLYPTHIVMWIICIIVYGGTTYFISNMSTKQFWVGAALLQSFIPGDPAEWAFWGNGPSWSVSTELFFYVSFVFLVRLSNKERKAIWGGLVGIVLLNSILLGNATPIAGWLYYINPLFRLLDFLSGMLLCEWMESLSWRPETSASATRLEIVSLLVLSVFVVVSVTSGCFSNPRFISYYYLFPCVFIIFAFSFNQGMISRFLGTKLFQVLGNCSFTFYLVHQFALYIVKRMFGIQIVDLSTMFLCAAGGFIIALIASVLLHYCFEKPVDQFAREIWNKRKREGKTC